MFAGYLEPTPTEPLPYRVVVRRLGKVVRVQPVRSLTEGNRALTALLRGEREYEEGLLSAIELD
jgi:hypothetical protein